MLTPEDIDFLSEMTAQLHMESHVDKLIILDKLRTVYHPDTSFSSKEISTICGFSRDKVRLIERQSIRRLHHPASIKPFLEYCSMSEHEEYADMTTKP